jgi:hypothetical protein
MSVRPDTACLRLTHRGIVRYNLAFLFFVCHAGRQDHERHQDDEKDAHVDREKFPAKGGNAFGGHG